jgi:hypothetical protein
MIDESAPQRVIQEMTDDLATELDLELAVYPGRTWRLVHHATNNDHTLLETADLDVLRQAVALALWTARTARDAAHTPNAPEQ